jgi:hypothetical protein
MTVSVPPLTAFEGAVTRGGNLACSLVAAAAAEELPELLEPPLELPELLDLLLEPQAASPSDAVASSPGSSTPSNLDLDRIFLPFV